MQASDGAHFLRTAYERGLGDQGFLFIGSDALGTSSLWEGDPTLSSSPPLRQQVLHGLFAIAPSSHAGEAAYESYLARRRALTVGGGERGGCDFEEDDNHKYLWAGDHDLNSSTPLRCAHPEVGVDGPYDVYAYDAVYAIAHALHELIERRRRPTIDGSELLEVLIQGGGEGGFVEAGIWTPCEVQSCSWIQRWSTGVPATFPGGGRDPPMQTGECRYGEVRSKSGSCVCGVGFRAEDDGDQCVPCPLFTSSAEGEGDCNVCAAGRYRQTGVAASSDNCKPCLAGAICDWNSTLATIHVKRGFWRLSPLTSRLYACDTEGEEGNISSACNGGIAGDVSCSPGHAGP
ncbi:MAG: hypothetical protein SGPRY_006236, partial [Prymnesium sp.]